MPPSGQASERRKTPVKVAVFCQAGLARSHAVVWALKVNHRDRADAVAAGVEANGPELLRTLVDWADRVIVLEKGLEEGLPEGARKKLVLFDVGPDIWKNPLHPDLWNRAIVLTDAWKEDGYPARGAYSLRPK